VWRPGTSSDPGKLALSRCWNSLEGGRAQSVIAQLQPARPSRKLLRRGRACLSARGVSSRLCRRLPWTRLARPGRPGFRLRPERCARCVVPSRFLRVVSALGALRRARPRVGRAALAPLALLLGAALRDLPRRGGLCGEARRRPVRGRLRHRRHRLCIHAAALRGRRRRRCCRPAAGQALLRSRGGRGGCRGSCRYRRGARGGRLRLRPAATQGAQAAVPATIAAPGLQPRPQRPAPRSVGPMAHPDRAPACTQHSHIGARLLQALAHRLAAGACYDAERAGAPLPGTGRCMCGPHDIAGGRQAGPAAWHGSGWLYLHDGP